MNGEIKNVSDTALWVSYYRAEETERKDALFHDPYAKKLAGEKGKKIAESMKKISMFTSWTVVMRTVIIDRYLQKLITEENVDCIINLGAGLDARPYRMKLPPQLQWFEADYPHLIDYKAEQLKNDSPQCKLTRVSIDLADDEKRKTFLSEMNSKFQRIAVLTEGIMPYLTLDQGSALAHDLSTQSNILYWMAEYISPAVYPHLKGRERAQKLKNAPFVFFPSDWLGFFSDRGWKVKEITYSGEEAQRQGRSTPLPLIARILKLFFPKKIGNHLRKMSGFVLFTRIK